MSSYVPLTVATLLPQAGNFFTSMLFPDMTEAVFSKDSKVVPWYDTLKLPPWTPPKWAFPPVWFGLYSSIGYASYLVWRDGGGFEDSNLVPLGLYGVNLLSNWMWSPLFFSKRLIQWSLVDVLCTWTTAIVCGKLFYEINPTAGYLFVPYVAWLTLATSVVYGAWRDNPQEKSK